MYAATIHHSIEAACRKVEQHRANPLAFWAGCGLGGAYVGFGVLLILSVGSHLPASLQKIGMGLTFALALVLVVVAGAELFTGYAMYMFLGRLSGRISRREAWRSMLACWVGNLMGSATVATLFALAGGNGLFEGHRSLLFEIAAAKTSAAPLALIARGLLCNWLVCLALWMSMRVDSDTAKCIVLFWCLLALITCGLEHSVANMTLLCLSWIGHHFDLSTLLASFYNLSLVSLGNLLGGSLMVAGMYWLAARGVAQEHDHGMPPVEGTHRDAPAE